MSGSRMVAVAPCVNVGSRLYVFLFHSRCFKQGLGLNALIGYIYVSFRIITVFSMQVL